jgi:PHD/YefM family antitoxin component YafN of YafNO toxin-antitoxin module
MKSTISHARRHLAEIWGDIERTQTPLILHRKGHADIVLLPAIQLVRLRDAVLEPFLELLGNDIDEQPERMACFPHALLARMRRLSDGIPVDHNAPISGPLQAECDAKKGL